MSIVGKRIEKTEFELQGTHRAGIAIAESSQPSQNLKKVDIDRITWDTDKANALTISESNTVADTWLTSSPIGNTPRLSHLCRHRLRCSVDGGQEQNTAIGDPQGHEKASNNACEC